MLTSIYSSGCFKSIEIVLDHCIYHLTIKYVKTNKHISYCKTVNALTAVVYYVLSSIWNKYLIELFQTLFDKYVTLALVLFLHQFFINTFLLCLLCVTDQTCSVYALELISHENDNF